MRDYAASARDRLLSVSRAQKIDYQLLLVRYFQERLLHRLSCTGFTENFCLKGGALLYALQQEKIRPTLDIDFSGRKISGEMEHLRTVFQEICKVEYPADGVTFDPDSVVASLINKEGRYSGTRLKINAQLGNIRQQMQVDIGFGDVITPGPVSMIFPTILDLDAPNIRAYSVETVIAEKFQAMIELAEANSRMKDFYDVYYLLRLGKHDPIVLEAAIKATFLNRQTPIMEHHSLFTEAFAQDKMRVERWNAFLRKSKLEFFDFALAHQAVIEHLKPIFDRI